MMVLTKNCVNEILKDLHETEIVVMVEGEEIPVISKQRVKEALNKLTAPGDQVIKLALLMELGLE